MRLFIELPTVTESETPVIFEASDICGVKQDATDAGRCVVFVKGISEEMRVAMSAADVMDKLNMVRFNNGEWRNKTPEFVPC